MKDIVKIIIALSIMIVGIYGVGWFIKELIEMCLEVGG